MFYADLNISLQIIPSNSLRTKDTLVGMEDETDLEDDNSSRVVLTNEVKKVGVIIDRG